MSPPTECVFCAIAAGHTAAAKVLDEPEICAFLDQRPLFAGHVLVVPRGHVETLAELPSDAVAPLFLAVQRMAGAVERAMGAEGSFVAVNNRVSQSVPHLHVHVVPRRKGDGLRGFFWPRTQYAADEERDEVARRIVAALQG
jgi:histidine triad (HIT) family protein